MFKKISFFVIYAVFAVNLCGCALLLAGAAGGVGTAAWLGGKLSQEVDQPKDRVIVSVKKAMSALKLDITKETATEGVVQFIGEYSDGRQVWIDVRALGLKSSKIDVRVGMAGDKNAAEEIMNKIKRYL